MFFYCKLIIANFKLQNEQGHEYHKRFVLFNLKFAFCNLQFAIDLVAATGHFMD